jgi:signal transduction histidine kinase
MRLTASGFVSYDERDGLGSSRRVASIFQDRAGELCIVTDDTISKFDGRRLTAIPVTLPAGIPNWGWGWYQIMFQDSAGEWWFNTFLGLVRYPRVTSVPQLTEARPKAIYKERDGLPNTIIFRLFEDSRRDIWISTLGKPKAVLTRWDRATETFHSYQPADGIPESAPTAFCEDGAGNLWIGFYDGGLLRYRDGRFTPFTNSDGVPPGMVRGLYLDHAGRLWIATAEGGVARVDQPAAEHPSFVTYSATDGLSSNQATCVTEDNWGMIYIGTGRGLDKLDPATGNIRHYSTADGLANSFVNVSYRHPDGSLWFGTLQGLSRLIPEPDPPAVPPRILITGLRFGGIPQAISEVGAAAVSGLQAGADQNNVEIEYSGLSFAAGESLQYQYKLEGASADWSAPSDQRAVAYASLPSGSYRFLVRAVSSRGTPSHVAAIASFTILPPIWQRWWFRLVALALVAAPIVALVRYRYLRARAVREAEAALRRSREERLAELERVRTRIATDLHDDIGSSLSQIYLLSEVVRQRAGRYDSEVTGPLEMICAASHDVVNSMSDIVWSINPQKDHLSDLIQRMRRFASDTLATRDIAFRFSAPDDGIDIRLGADVRREVFLIFKESINNLVRHSCCTEAEIDFRLAGDWLSLIVEDNGRGFDGSNDGQGHGIASMRERAKTIGGQLELVTGTGGTMVKLHLQVGEKADGRVTPPADVPASTGGDTLPPTR